MSILVKGSNPGCHTALTFQSSILCFNREFLTLSLTFVTSTILRMSGQFCSMSLPLGLSDNFLMTSFKLWLFSRNTREEFLLLIPYQVVCYFHFFFPLTGSANLDYLIRVLSARFPHCKVTLFLFVINKYFWGAIFRLYKYILILNKLLPNTWLLSIENSCPN